MCYFKISHIISRDGRKGDPMHPGGDGGVLYVFGGVVCTRNLEGK